jgi:hypothetical protein
MSCRWISFIASVWKPLAPPQPKHRCYYFPRMERNEAILLKCYDSMDDGRARFTAHTSFEDPSSPPLSTSSKNIV